MRNEESAAGLFVAFRRTALRGRGSRIRKNSAVRHSRILKNSATGVARIVLRHPVDTPPIALKRGQQAVLAQEVRSPFAGRYKLSLKFRGQGSATTFAEAFGKHLACRLVFFQFNNQKKTPRERRELAAVSFQPKLGEWQTIELEKNFINPTPGGNFSFGSGLGVAVIVESRGDWTFATTGTEAAALLEIAEVNLRFIGKERIETVKV